MSFLLQSCSNSCMLAVEEHKLEELEHCMQPSCTIEPHDDLLLISLSSHTVWLMFDTNDWSSHSHSEQRRNGRKDGQLHPDFFSIGS